MPQQSERGAVAVEFALILPILLMLVLGIVEFGRAYNTQISLTHAARESVRVMAISDDPTRARTVAINTAVTLYPALVDTNIAITTNNSANTARCAPGARATVTISYTQETLTGFAGPFAMTGKGVMQCGG